MNIENKMWSQWDSINAISGSTKIPVIDGINPIENKLLAPSVLTAGMATTQQLQDTKNSITGDSMSTIESIESSLGYAVERITALENSSSEVNVTTKTTNTTLGSSDDIVLIDGAKKITLPSATISQNKKYTIKSINNITPVQCHFSAIRTLTREGWSPALNTLFTGGESIYFVRGGFKYYNIIDTVNAETVTLAYDKPESVNNGDVLNIYSEVRLASVSLIDGIDTTTNEGILFLDNNESITVVSNGTSWYKLN